MGLALRFIQALYTILSFAYTAPLILIPFCSIYYARSKKAVAKIFFVGLFFMLLACMTNEVMGRGLVLFQSVIAVLTVRIGIKSLRVPRDITCSIIGLWSMLLLVAIFVMSFAYGWDGGFHREDNFNEYVKTIEAGALTALLLVCSFFFVHKWLVSLLLKTEATILP